MSTTKELESAIDILAAQVARLMEIAQANGWDLSIEDD